MAASTLVADCSAQQYCSTPDQALGYGDQFVVHWNNQLPPLNPESLVTLAVYSTYDPATPLYQVSGVSNTNGQATLKPDAKWFSRYTGNDSSTGRNQQVYFAVYLQGNDPPPLSSMLPLRLTATEKQYAEIQAVLHPPTVASAAPSATQQQHETAATARETDPEKILSSVVTRTSGTVPQPTTATTTATTVRTTTASLLPTSSVASTASDATSGTRLPTSSPTNDAKHGRDGLSGGAIAGIVVGSVVGLALLVLLVLVPFYRRRQRRRHMLSKSAELKAAGTTSTSLSAFDGTSAAAAAAAAAGGVAGGVAGGGVLSEKARQGSPTDTPLLVGGRPNNSFTSQDGGSVGSDGTSPDAAGGAMRSTYQPLSLESPRVMVDMPASTRSASAAAAGAAVAPGLRVADPILSSDDARQIGDIFRDALRKPPVSEEDTSESPGHRESLLDDALEEEADPGWRERVASERMQRELQQEASVIRSVAMRAHGSDYSSSRPGTSRSGDDDENNNNNNISNQQRAPPH
ncbi:hypothetical protein GGI07_002745 [Coemansia sp. Benny D115]|nr:hypothetical protein GGI07_002745 [Coemansia sp. Benny D115]